MDTLITMKKIDVNHRKVRVLGTMSRKFFWAEALTKQGVFRSVGKTLDEAVKRVTTMIKKAA